MKEKSFQKKLDNIADSLWLYEGATPISNISQKLKLPRSTVSDWIHRCQERKITWKALVQSTLETQATWLFGSLKENSEPFLDKEDAFFREVRLQKLTIKENIELYKECFGEECTRALPARFAIHSGYKPDRKFSSLLKSNEK